MNATLMLRDFADAVERHDGSRFAKLFAADGVYHDVFYGAFEGRAKVATMIDDWFYRTARDFRWDFHQPVSDGTTLYARYTFRLCVNPGGSSRQTRRLRGCRGHAAS